MKIYLDKNDIGKTITFREENGKRQYLYVHDKEGFVFKNLEELQNQKAIECLKEVKDLINKDFTIAEDYWKVTDIIDNKIKELEGE